jgi:hypothetical protein
MRQEREETSKLRGESSWASLSTLLNADLAKHSVANLQKLENPTFEVKRGYSSFGFVSNYFFCLAVSGRKSPPPQPSRPSLPRFGEATDSLG